MIQSIVKIELSMLEDHEEESVLDPIVFGDGSNVQ